jgi:uncharacterized RDD family membrane protein YckC
MNWYYIENGQQAGPVQDAQLQALVQQRRIQPETLIWREGMANWEAAQQTVPQLFAAPAAPQPAQPVQAAQPAQPAQPAAPQVADPMAFDPLAVPDVFGSSSGIAASLGEGASGMSGLDSIGLGAIGGEVMCCACGNLVPRDQTTDMGGKSVCAACAPTFDQQATDGAPAMASYGGYSDTSMNYAGFWIRFVAWILDWVILLPVLAGISFLLGGGSIMFSGGVDPEQLQAMMQKQQLISLVATVFLISYVTFFGGKFGGTPGKLICGLRIVTGDGDRVTYLRAFARYWGEVVTSLTGCLFGFGYIMAAFHGEKCALHDLICGTRVVWK